MSGLPARTRNQTEGEDRAGIGGENLAVLVESCRGFPDIPARCLSVFPCREGNLRKIMQSKIGVAHRQSLGLGWKLSQLVVVAF